MTAGRSASDSDGDRTAGAGSSRTGAAKHASARVRGTTVAIVAAAVAVALVAAGGIGVMAWRGMPSDSGVPERPVAAEEADATPEHDAMQRQAVPDPDAGRLVQLRMDALRDELETLIAGYSGNWQVYCQNLATGASLTINNHQGYSASVIKLYVMLAVYQRIHDGALAEDETIDELLRQMITVSSNEATNTLVDIIGGGDGDTGFAIVNDTAKRYGFQDSFITQYLGDISGDPSRKRTSAEDCGRFMAAVYRGELVSEDASRSMLDLLLTQTRVTKIPGGVPEGTVTANKTGEIDGVENDAAIVFASADTSAAIDGTATEGDYVLTVLTEDVPDSETAQAEIRELSGVVWNAMES